jgi:O-antigen ligase
MSANGFIEDLGLSSSNLLLRLFALGVVSVFLGVLLFGFSIDTAMYSILLYFLLASLFTPFNKNPRKAFSWLILINSVLVIYQTTVYVIDKDSPLIAMVVPLILSSLLFVPIIRKVKFNYELPFVILILGVPSLYSFILGSHINVHEAVIIFYLNVLFPIFIYIGIFSFNGESTRLLNLISSNIFLMLVIAILLIPIELLYQGKSHLATLQFGGGQYSLIGLLILSAPFLYEWYRGKASGYAKLFIALIIFLIFATSFSKGSILIGIMTVFGVLIFTRNNINFLKLVILLATTYVFIIFGIELEFINDAFTYWAARLDGLFDNIFIVIELIKESGRGNIWSIGVSQIENNPVFGQGIGSSSEIIKQESDFTFSGFHSNFLTVFVERGIAGVLLIGYLIAKYLVLATKVKLKAVSQLGAWFFYLLFVLFSNTTGVELFMYSSKSVNVNILIYMVILIGYLEVKNNNKIHNVF